MRGRFADAAWVAVVLALAWAVKRFYSQAGFDDLAWVLVPTVRLVEWSTGVTFELEPHHGYLSRGARFEVAPACAGVNFLIVAFLSLCLGPGRPRAGGGRAARFVLACALAAYAATVLANATRIAIAVRMHGAGLAWGPLTAARLHCAEGVAVYLLFLFALVALAARVTGERHAPTA